jgi:hypothetical protein
LLVVGLQGVQFPVMGEPEVQVQADSEMERTLLYRET